MTTSGLCVLVTPSAAGSAWREALTARAVQLGWPVHDLTADPGQTVEAGLAFTYSHAEMQTVPMMARVALIDTTATDPIDPSQPASPADIMIRSQVLVQAEMAAADGAVILNAARYTLDFPALGPVERSEGTPYRIHPSVSESPLAIFDDTTPGASATWAPRWFTYSEPHQNSAEEPLIDLTGRMRPVIHGPYVYLPAGRWRVDLRFTCDPERAHAPLLFEWGAGSDYSRLMTEIRHRGAYAVSLDRIWPEPDAAQLRIWPAHPVFQGRFGFSGCRVTRVAIDDPAPVTPTDRIVEAAVV